MVRLFFPVTPVTYSLTEYTESSPEVMLILWCHRSPSVDKVEARIEDIEQSEPTV